MNKYLKDYTLVTDPQEVGAVLSELDQVDILAFDLETTSLDFNRGTIHGIALATEDKEWYVCLGAEKAMIPKLSELFKGKTVITHNGKFDLHFFDRYDIRPEGLVDTMVGQHLVDENQLVGLKELARTKLGIREKIPDYHELQKLGKKLTNKRRISDVTIYDIPLETLAEYAGRDARWTYDLWKITEHELARESMLDFYHETSMPFLYVLMDMESNGFYINQRALNEAEKVFGGKLEEATEKWDKLTDGVNYNSPLQLSKLFYEDMGFEVTRWTKSENPNPSTDITALHRLVKEDDTGTLDTLITIRKYDKLIGTYVTAFRDNLFNGRLHGSFNQTGAVTGRLSSSGPNLQNIPGRGDEGYLIRSLFAASPGYVMVVIDYSQVEMRLLAHYTKDRYLMDAFLNGIDVHQMTADRIAALGYLIERKDAKQVNFGWAYGIGPYGLQDTIEKASGSRPDYDDCLAWLKGYGKAYPDANRWKWRVIDYAKELGYVRTIAGRRRHLPEINSSVKSLASSAGRQAVNSIIQGSAADVINWAMLRGAEIQGRYGARMLAQVHDEIVWEVPEENAQEFALEAQKVMQSAGDHFMVRLPLLAEPGIGPHWADAK